MRRRGRESMTKRMEEEKDEKVRGKVRKEGKEKMNKRSGIRTHEEATFM